MAERITKTQRWLDLIALLLGRRIPLSVEEVMERVPAYAGKWRTGDATAVASARRMFERDKDELRAAGIPLETVRYGIGRGEDLEGYRISRNDFYLPYLRLVSEAPARGGARPYPALGALDLAPAEAALAVDALRRVADLPSFPFAVEARSALRKLAFDIDPERFPGESVLWVERPGSREVLERLRILSDALLARKRVAFTYHGIRRGRATERDVAPYGLFFQRDWYLVGRDATRDAIRVFRVARMEGVRANARAPKQPDYAIPAGFVLRDYLDRSAWELGDDGEAIAAEVRFEFPLSIRAARNGEGEPVREEAGGAAVRRFRVAQANPFLRWILGLGGEAEILSPPELREQYEAMLREVAALYGDGEREGARG